MAQKPLVFYPVPIFPVFVKLVPRHLNGVKWFVPFIMYESNPFWVNWIGQEHGLEDILDSKFCDAR